MPTPYVKQTWVDGVAGGTPLSAARLAYIESGIENATLPDSAYVSSADGAFVPATADAVLFVSPSGNDANNGKSWGKAKLTLQAAHDALPATGGRILVAAGSIAATSAPFLAVTKPDVTLEGVGVNTVLSRNYSPALTVASTAHRFRMVNVKVKHDGDGNLDSIVKVTGATDCVFEGVVFDGSSATADFASFVRLTDSPRTVVERCHVIGANGATRRVSVGIDIRGASNDCWIVNNVVSGCRTYGIDIRGTSEGCRVKGNRVSDVGADAGIKVWVGHTLVAGNYVTSTGGSCIDINGDVTDNPGGGNNRGCVVIGNDCTGDRINLETDVHDAVIANNIIRNSRGNGISMVNNITDIDIIGNVIIAAAHATGGGIASYIYQAVVNARLNILGNSIRSAVNAGILIESGTDSYVSGNHITGCAKGIHNTMAGAVMLNLGVNHFAGNTADLTGTFQTRIHSNISGPTSLKTPAIYAGNADPGVDGTAQSVYVKGTDADGRTKLIFHNSGTPGRKYEFTATDAGAWRVYDATGGGTALEISGFSLRVPNGDLLVRGNKVVGAQGAAVADATDAASAITQLNALLARLRTHGLIAP